MKGNGKSLEARVARGLLTIEIGTYVLAHAASYSDWANTFNETLDNYVRTFAITDADGFAKDVVHAMLHEAEDGSSPLFNFIDKMMQAALDDGSEHVEYEQRIKHGETSPLEGWAKR